MAKKRDLEQIGKRLKLWLMYRELNGKPHTYHWLAGRLGTYHSRVSEWANGHASPARKFWGKLSDQGLSIEWLFLGKGKMENKP